jgi:hypothetical protein
MPSLGKICLVATALIVLSGVAHAGPRCSRPPGPARALPVNSFADSPAPRAIEPAHEKCAWSLGLAMLPGDTGTAALVANRREIVTNLHVVDPDCGGNARFEFRHGFVRGRALGVIGATVVARGGYCAGRKLGLFDYGGDWAIAVLDRDPGLVERGPASAESRPLTLDASPVADLRRDNGRFFLLGYGVDFEDGRTPFLSPRCALDRLFSQDVVEHRCNASHRSSGAPIVRLDRAGDCDLVAIHVGALAEEPGRPRYLTGVNANIAILSERFAAAVAAVDRDLNAGLDARQIARHMRARPASR